MDASKDICTYLKIDVREDNCGNIVLETILRELTQNWPEYIKEETRIQTNAINMVDIRDHITIERTPKFHPKLSFNGID